MSSLDKVDNIFFYIKRYLLPSIFLGVGIFVLYLALTPEIVEVQNPSTGKIQDVEISQEPMFMYSALIIIFVSVVWFLYLFDMIKSFVGWIVLVVMLSGSAYILYQNVNTVKTQIDFDTAWDVRDLEIKTRMADIKAAEAAYKESDSTYTNSMDDLINFVKTGKKMDIVKIGTVPDRKISLDERDLIYGDDRPIDNLMTEMEATVIARYAGGKVWYNEDKGLIDFSRDTNYIPVMEAIFDSERYQISREKIGGLIPFNADSLRYVPFTTNLVVLDTSSIMKSDMKVPTLLIEMTHPMDHPDKGYKLYQIGSKTDNHLKDNWSK
ncbi:MAG: hypothetical protein ACI857_002383 [Arenicella sp.]|jgi:hypothetical protein